ncbi:MAG: alpha-galactosidase [Lachnospiraceae bacterium]|nr:alpha-galactosidase [Lachnospiraceae bacterium]
MSEKKENCITKESLGIVPISEIVCGDMLLKYELDTNSGIAGFYIIPRSMREDEVDDKFYRVNNMVQYKLVGDVYPGSYGNGATFRNSGSAKQLKYVDQKVAEDEDKITVRTFLRDERGYEATHIVRWYRSDLSVEMSVCFWNKSSESVRLEAISSFELGNLTPFVRRDAPDSVLVHRLRSKWSEEGRLDTQTVEDLQLEPSWSTWAVSVEKFGQTGSMPVKKFFPFLSVEDKKSGAIWGVQLKHEASWQMELYRQDDALHISGGLADREFGHWMKDVAPDKSFTTPIAVVSVCEEGGIDAIGYRLTQAGQKYLNSNSGEARVTACDISDDRNEKVQGTHTREAETRRADACEIKRNEMEDTLPILFNEYCTTWGNPSHENIEKIVNTIRGKGFSYFVIDCGWFKEDGIPWDISMGDYNVSPTLFPKGIKATAEMIREAGMVPGIWFEIDNIGRAAHAYEEQTAHMLTKDGIPITTENRRFWDMNDPWVQDYFSEKVIGLLKSAGFGYMKMDYNDTIGIGCDGCESLGEGLRKNMEASASFVEKVRREVPGIILENCSSGGHKLEPLMMSLCDMASFSDAHECEEIPIIAANLHRAILPRQSQIWAVIRKHDSLRRIAYSIANTFLGRMCLSGDVTELTDEQWDVIDRGMAFYREIAPIIRDGRSYRFGTHITSERHPKGWQGIVRVKTSAMTEKDTGYDDLRSKALRTEASRSETSISESLDENSETGDIEKEQAYVVIHTFAAPWPKEIRIELPEGCPEEIQSVYSDSEADIRVEDGILIYRTEEEKKAVAVRLG